MLTRVDVINDQGESLSLPLRDISSGYVVKDVEGLGPVKAALVSYPFANLDGEEEQSIKREPRNIILKLDFDSYFGAQTVSELRQGLYGFLMPKSRVQLRFYLDDVAYCSIAGRVEDFDTPMFSQEPDATISIMCTKPDFLALFQDVMTSETVNALVFDDLAYLGTIEAGFEFEMTLTRDITALSLQTQYGSATQTLDFVYDMLAGDILRISTVPGSKFARITRDGVEGSVLWGVTPSSTWFTLRPGLNKIRAYVGGDPIPFSLEYTRRYGGL